MKRNIHSWLVFLSLFGSTFLFSQPDMRHNKRLKIFMDCSTTWCDMTFIRTEINIVDFMLDRVASDVHVLVTSQGTGGGGSQYQMIFYGQNGYRSQLDTIKYDIHANATATETRELMILNLKLGLIPFIKMSGNISGVTISMKQDGTMDKKALQNMPVKDPWNYWVITTQADGSVSGEQSYKGFGYSGNVSVNRVTEAIKVGFDLYGSNKKETFTYDTDSSSAEFIAKNSNYGFQHYLAKSINNHWSAGYQTIFSNSTFSNYKKQWYIRAAVEYNIFPYQEVNSRSFTFSYGIITRFNWYYDTSIYNKMQETLFAHSFRAHLNLNKKWGTINAGIFYANYFHDWNLNNLGVDISANIRITGGLSFYIYTSGGIVHDQLYLPKQGASEQEVLTKIRQLKTSFNFQNRFGISYRFGSKLNNFVNPRFNNG